MNSILKKYLEFKNKNQKIFGVFGTIATGFTWIFFILGTLAQIYFNTLPFDEAVANTGDALNTDFYYWFNTSENIFYNDFLIGIFIDLFDPIFISSAVVALLGTWVLSQGRTLWEMFLLFLTLAIPRVRREWGLVFNRSTNKPVEFAFIRLYGKNGTEKVFINQSVTDLDGRYRIYLPNTYKDFIVEIAADGFTPSYTEINTSSDDLSFFDSEVGLAPTGEVVEEKFSIKKLKIKIKDPVTYIVFVLSTIVTIHSLYGLLAIPQIDTLIFLVIYGGAWLWNLNVLKNRRKKIEGMILSRSSNKPITGAFLRLYDINKQLVASEVTDKTGIANFKVEPGRYLLLASRENIKSVDNSFIDVEVNTKGYLNKNIEIDMEDDAITTQTIPNPFG